MMIFRNHILQEGLTGIVIGIILIIPYFLWHSFWCFGMSLIITSLSIMHLLYSLFKNNGEDIFFGTGVFATIIFSSLCLLWNDNRYITATSNMQHIYEDCTTLSKSEDIKMVTETEGFFHLAFSDCKVCEERLHQTHMQQQNELKEIHRNQLRSYLQEMINRLDTGEDPRRIEAQLTNFNSSDEDEGDYVQGIPSRLQ